MKIEYITINAGQRFDAVMPEIPTNSIINKTVTGCGATYAEINAPRHSVIIEPNVPVIEGKLKKHPQILGVFEGVTTEDIIDFLNTNYNDGYLKIMTTPESFPKVRSAMIQTHTDMHGEWFMLFDECERTIQDAGYRGSITLPMDDFFRCKQKAMVSATPIIPSDPRFEQQGFTMKILRPTYDHKPKMLLIHTNNTVGWVRTLMGQVKGKGHPLCIFLNSTDTIHRMICTYKIEKRCKVFCSYESVKKLRKRDFSRAYSSLEELDEINFFTSRFFSAVDIELPTTACVLIVTDLSFAAHTVIDPTDRSRADRRTLPQRRGGCRAYFQHQQGDALQIAGGDRHEVGGVRSGLQTSPANRSVGGGLRYPCAGIGGNGLQTVHERRRNAQLVHVGQRL